MGALTRDLRNQAQADSYLSDLSIGVGRERAILAELAGNLVSETVLEKSAGGDSAHIGCPDLLDVRGRRVLIAVAELPSGRDLRAAVEPVAEWLPDAVGTVALLTHPAAGVEPDCSGALVKRPFTAPWPFLDSDRSGWL
jgi:Flp pilus assembly protein CpaB